MNFVLLALVTAQEDALVRHWLHAQPDEWAHTLSHCAHVAVLFSDAAWLALTLRTAHEIVAGGECVALWLWLTQNASAVPLCDRVPCFVDRRVTDSAQWGTRRYFNKIAIRLPVMLALVQQLPLGGALALLDSDVAVLRRHLFARIARIALLAHNATIAVQQEWPCSTAPLRLCVNGGVWWLRRSTGAREFLARAVALMHRLALPDQDALEVALAERTADFVHYLDRRRYVNGYTAQRDGVRGAHLVHANWLTGIDAKRRLLDDSRRHGFCV